MTDISSLLLALTIGSTAALLAWYALGAFADLIDAREDEEPDTDPEEPR